MKAQKISMIAVAISMIFVALPLLQSCKQTGHPSVGNIWVKDETGTAVPNAVVRVFCVPGEQVVCSDSVEVEGTTDSEGYFRFEFPEPAVLKIDVRLEDSLVQDTGIFPNTNTIKCDLSMCGEGWITLNEQKNKKKENEADAEVTVSSCEILGYTPDTYCNQ